jgi:aryl-alcohol dehydrogenase-like predicted oxidoreductase
MPAVRQFFGKEQHMEKRRLGKTGHMSSILTFGAAALWQVSQPEADSAIEMAVDRGVNHFDVAPAYGEAELRLGPRMQKHRQSIFLACKTQQRGKKNAWESLQRSLEKLRVDYFDLFQLHGVSDLETLNMVLSPIGALEAVLEARQQGLIRHIGITGHRSFVLCEALNRFDFETVLFPLNRVIAAHFNDFNDYRPLMDLVLQKDVGTIAIKSVTKRPWEGPMHMHKTWYEPFDKPSDIQKSVSFTLSQGVTTLAMAGDLSLWPAILDAGEKFKPLSLDEQTQAIEEVRQYQPLFR